jgi:hypothetical protein
VPCLVVQDTTWLRAHTIGNTRPALGCSRPPGRGSASRDKAVGRQANARSRHGWRREVHARVMAR